MSRACAVLQHLRQACLPEWCRTTAASSHCGDVRGFGCAQSRGNSSVAKHGAWSASRVRWRRAVRSRRACRLRLAGPVRYGEREPALAARADRAHFDGTGGAPREYRYRHAPFVRPVVELHHLPDAACQRQQADVLSRFRRATTYSTATGSALAYGPFRTPGV